MSSNSSTSSQRISASSESESDFATPPNDFAIQTTVETSPAAVEAVVADGPSVRGRKPLTSRKIHYCSCDNGLKKWIGYHNYYNHKKEIHEDNVKVGSTIFTRDSEGYFKCPGCSRMFKGTSAIFRSHTLCVEGSEADVDLQPVDRNPPANRSLEAILAVCNMIKSDEGRCIVCIAHNCILGKISQQ